jgi:hypothetical protein
MAQPRNNILHNYANYTYNLQLWAITKDDFNKVAAGIGVGSEDSILQSGELLISNGGMGVNEPRSQFFQDIDMVIDNLEIETIIGNKGKSARGTDAISLKFEIIEPYTVTLLDRLYNLAQVKAPGSDFKALIYCLKIQFFGYNDTGQIINIPATKWFPITLLNMKFSVTQKGATYNVQAIPASHAMLTNIDNVIPFHVELQGQTMQDLFSADNVAVVALSSNPRTDSTSLPYGSNSSVIKSIKDALDKNETFKVRQGSQKYPNVYKFEFDNDLLNAKVLDPSNVSIQSLPFAPVTGTDGQTARYRAQVGSIQIDNVNGAFRTQAGTKITDFIQAMFIVSDFMRNQVSSTPGGGDPNKPFVGIKITPKMKIIDPGYDPVTKNYVREMTYVVKKFEHTGEDHPDMPQKPPNPADAVKTYEYIFTGNNKDVINLNLNYQMAFFETRNAGKQNLTNNANDSTGDTPDTSSTQQPDSTNDRRLARPGIAPRSLDASRSNTSPVENDFKTLTVAEMMSKLFDNIADTISLDITIVGDPDWIQQDNVLYASVLPTTDKIASNGVINFQDSITHFNLTFKSPTKDYNDVSGLLDVSSGTTAIFSGLYHVISVTSSFRKGKFTQKLVNNRIRTQNANEIPKPTSSPLTQSNNSALSTQDGRPVTAVG